MKYEKFSKLLDLKGIKASEVARATGIANTTFSDWKNGKSVPKADKIHKIAEFFGVKDSYFSDDADSEIPTPVLSDECAELIELYSKMSKENQDAIMKIMRTMTMSNK